MGKTIEAYVATIITVVFVALITLSITKQYNQLYEENNKEHHVEETVWMIEQERCVRPELLKDSFEIKCFSDNGETITYNPASGDEFPDNVKYVHITYGGKGRWIVYE